MPRRSKAEAASARRQIAAVRKAVAGAGFVLRCETRGELYAVRNGPGGRVDVGRWHPRAGIIYLRPKAPRRLLAALVGCPVRVVQ